jgi:hypothetical protein
MKKEKRKSSVQDFADTIKDNPAEIIAWAKREIKEYESLIDILEKQIKSKLK